MSLTPPMQFAALLAKSNLLTAEQLQAAQAELATARESELRQLVEVFVDRGWLTRWQGQMLLGGRHAFFLGRYKLLDHLGEGGMGSVLKAEQTPLGRLVAIKTLRKELVSSPEMVARFHREIQAAAALSHPNIVAAYDADEVAGRHFLVMEYIEGCDLSESVKGGKQLSIGEACEYIRQAALGLEHAFERGMVHRDIKPSNLLLDTTGRVKILDMGLARIVQGHGNEQTELTHTGQVVGTPDYISPEQSRDTKSADIRSDIYSLGCSLYRLLTGRVPFEGDEVIAKITARLMEDAPRLRDALPAAPQELEAVLLKMMARDVEQRYQTPAEVAAVLQPFARIDAAKQNVSNPAAPQEARLFEKAGLLPAPELNDFLNQLADEAAHDAEVDTGTQDLQPTLPVTAPQASGGRQPPDAFAPTMVFGPEQDQPADADRSPKISRAGRKLQDQIAARKQADKRKLLIVAMAVTLFVAVVVGLVVWQKAGETMLIVDWPLDEREQATIEINGRAVTLVNQSRLRFSGPPGKRTLKITRSGYELIEDSFDLGRGETKTFQPQWLPTTETTRQQQLAALTLRVEAFRKASRGGHPPGPDGGDQPHRSLDDPDVVALRNELVEFHTLNAGRPESIIAAQEMTRLPWSVDRLQPEDIDPYEFKVASTSLGGNLPKGLVAVLGDSRLKQWGQVNTVAFSPNGKTLASGSADSTIKLWDIATGRQLQTLDGHDGSVSSIAFSPNSQVLASGALDTEVKLWDLDTGETRKTLKGHEGIVRGVAFSPDGQLVASCGDDNSVRLWDATTGKEQLALKEHAGAVLCVAFSPDGEVVAAGSADQTVKLWQTKTGRQQQSIAAHQDAVLAVEFSPDGKTLATGGEDGTVKIWDLESWQERISLDAHSQTASSLAFAPDGKRIVTGGEHQTEVRFWNVETGQQTLEITGHQLGVFSVAFSPDGETVASASEDNSVKLWDASTGRERLDLPGHTSRINSVAIDSGGMTIATGGANGAVKLWQAATGTERLTIRANRGIVYSVGFSPLDNILASGGGVGPAVRFWNADSGVERSTLPGMSDFGNSSSVAFSPDGKTFASGIAANDSTLARLWDVSGGKFQGTLEGDPASVSSVAFSPDGKMLATGNSEGFIKLWSVTSGREMLSFEGGTKTIHSVAFSPDGRTLVSSGEDVEVKLWDAGTGRRLATLSGGRYSVAFSPDGRMVASSHHSVVRIWDAESRQLIDEFAVGARFANVYQLSFTPDGRHLITANGNGTSYVLRLKEFSAK